MKFNCTSCGLCCENVKLALSQKDHEYQELIDKFPYGTDEKGACSMYDRTTRTCKDYGNRPEICRVDVVFRKYHRGKIKQKEFFKASEEACKKLQEGGLLV